MRVFMRSLAAAVQGQGFTMKVARIEDLAACSATGGLRPHLLALASATGTLSPNAVKLLGGMLRELAETDAKAKAFSTICRALDPSGRLSPTALSIRLAKEYRDFKSRGYRRIAAGYRPVNTDLEAAMVVLCDCECPESPRRIRDKFKEFVNGTERCPK